MAVNAFIASSSYEANKKVYRVSSPDQADMIIRIVKSTYDAQIRVHFVSSPIYADLKVYVVN